MEKVKCLRTGKKNEGNTLDEKTAIPAVGFEDYLEVMAKGYEFYHKKMFDAARAELGAIHGAYPENLVAERDILVALCLNKRFELVHRERAVKILSEYRHRLVGESDLWLRLMFTLLASLAHTNRHQEAMKLQAQIEVHLRGRFDFDDMAEHNINILRRKATAFYSDEACKAMLLSSVKYFGSREGRGGIARDPIQFFMTATNLSGTLLNLGEFPEAFQYSREAMASYAAAEGSQHYFPRPQQGMNNFLLSSFLSGNSSSEQTERWFSAFLERDMPLVDAVLLNSNLAAFIAYNGNVEKALELVERQRRVIQDEENLEAYYWYYVDISRAIYQYLLGEMDTAGETIKSLRGNGCFTKTMWKRKHYEILSDLITNRKRWHGSPAEWNAALFAICPGYKGRPWRFFGQGFVFSDLQYWSET